MSKRRNTTSAAKYTPPALEEKAAREKHAYYWLLWRKYMEEDLKYQREYLEATGERMPTDPIGWARAAAKYWYPNYGQGVYSEGAIYAWVVERAREHAAAPAGATGAASRILNATAAADAAELDTWGQLTERQRKCLSELYDMRAFAASSLQPAETIAESVVPRGAKTGGFKVPLSDLRERRLVASKTGRQGGYWLTGAGRELVARRRPVAKRA